MNEKTESKWEVGKENVKHHEQMGKEKGKKRKKKEREKEKIRG